MQKLQDLKLSVVSLKKELAWAFVAEKKQVENIYEMIKIWWSIFLSCQIWFIVFFVTIFDSFICLKAK